MGRLIVLLSVLLLLTLVACEVQTATPSGASIIYTCYGEKCREAGNGQVFDNPKDYADPEPDVLPNYTEPRAKGETLSCQSLGCDSNTQLVGNPKTRLFYTCDCPAARDIPFNLITCIRSFDHAYEDDYVRSPDCK